MKFEDVSGLVIGAGGGALVGGLMGAIIAGRRRRLKGAGIGAAVGGLVGGASGYSEQRREENAARRVQAESWRNFNRENAEYYQNIRKRNNDKTLSMLRRVEDALALGHIKIERPTPSDPQVDRRMRQLLDTGMLAPEPKRDFRRKPDVGASSDIGTSYDFGSRYDFK